MLRSALSCLAGLAAVAAVTPQGANVSTWHVVWVGGQSNSVGTNSQVTGFPVWPTTPLIQMFNWRASTFSPATYPIYNEKNVGFSLTFANLLLQTLPAGHGVVIVNTGVGGTGFHDGNWVVPNGPLAKQSVAAVQALHAALPAALNGTYSLHSMLWHQGEEDAGDNRDGFHADYCTYLVDDMSALVDFLRSSLPGATNSTPFVNGGLLPYWLHAAATQGGTGGVPGAIAALNTSRACTATADSSVFPVFNPDGTPAGDPNYRSGASGDVIHFTATQATFLGFQYWSAYLRALQLNSTVPSDATNACPGAAVQPSVSRCGWEQH